MTIGRLLAQMFRIFTKILETCARYAMILALFSPALHKFEAKRFSFFLAIA
jgi:hypothetical protein